MKTTPYKYQVDLVKAIEGFDGRCLLAAEMGLGKSLCSLMYAERHPEIRPIVIVCPASLKWNWNREAKIHFGWRAEILESTTPPKTGYKFRQNIVVINYDILFAWLDYLKELKPQLVILDESQMIGNKGTRRTKACQTLCLNVPHIVALSGTPLLNKPAELWPTLNILQPKVFPNFWAFGMKWCDPKKNKWGWTFNGCSDSEKLHELLAKHTLIRKRKADVLEYLPAKRRFIVPLPLKDEEQYRLATEDFRSWLARYSPKTLKSSLRAESLVKLGHLLRLAATLKLPAVVDWVDHFLANSEGKLVLFTRHRKILAELERHFKKICVVVSGSVIGRKRQEAVERFQKDPKIKIFIGQIRAAGIGLNLHVAHTVAFVELDWVPGIIHQAEDRVYARLGNIHGADIYYLLGKHTIDSMLLKLIIRKQKLVSAILDKGKGENFDIMTELAKELLKGKTSHATHGNP